MGKKSTTKHICILRTGKLFEHCIAANTLNENGIPFYMQMETSSGLRLAMPFQVAMGPGTYYNILVPPRFSKKAKKLLNELPIEVMTEPEIWHFGTSEKGKRRWKIFVWVILILTLFIMLLNFVQT